MSETLTGLRTTVTSYEVSIWPEDCYGLDQAMYCCSVVYNGYGKWSVRRGSASSDAPCLGTDGQWHYEHIPSERTRQELAEHRFDLDTALDLARQHAPTVTLCGLTAEEALARHQHGAWCREPYSAD